MLVSKEKLLGGTGLLLAVALFLTVNVLTNTTLTSARLDFTEDGLYTLSDGTLDVITGLDEPITLRFYLSRHLVNELPGLSGYANRVQELLREYEIRSQGNLRLLVLDPEPFSEEEDRAVGYGIRGLALAQADEVFYFGLVGTNTVGEQKVVAYFNQVRERFLEYDVTRLIQQLSQTSRPTVGVLSTIPIQSVNADKVRSGAMPQPLTLIDQMRETFNVEALDLTVTDIPEHIDLLMLIHPRRLGEPTMYAIDQFAMRNGRVVAFVDPYAEADARQTASGIPAVTASDFNRVLASWGVRLAEDTVVTDLQFGTRVQTQQDGKAVVFDYPVWVTYPADLLNPFDVITGNLDNLTFASVGQLEVIEGSGLTVEPLVRSTTAADRVTVEQISFTADPQELLRHYEGEGEQFALVVRITGRAKSAFTEGAPAAEDFTGQDVQPATQRTHLEASQGDINVVVVADTDMLQDRYWVRVQDFLGSRIALPFAGNGSLVINALDNLGGSNALISVRSRGSFSRPFERVTEIRRDAELEYREKEQELITRLEQTEQELLALENQKQGDEALILSDAQQQRLNDFRDQRIQIRTELRDVRHDLRKDIETLEAWLKFVNIGLIPLLIGIGGVLIAILKRYRRKAAIAATTPPGLEIQA